jgi:hypothetical protein
MVGGDRAAKEKKAAEMALAESKGRLEAEKAALLKEVETAGEATRTAKADLDRVEGELRDYKVRPLFAPAWKFLPTEALIRQWEKFFGRLLSPPA